MSATMVEGFIDRPGGARIYYQVHGTSGPAVVLCDGIGCDGFAWKYLLPVLQAEHRVIRWHYRGHGRSTLRSPHGPVGMPENCGDLLAVLEAAGAQEAYLIGHSMGVQVSLEFHRCHPWRVLGLILICGSYGRPLETFKNSRLLGVAFPYLRRVVERFPTAARWANRLAFGSGLAIEGAYLLEVNRQLLRRGDIVPYFEHLAQMDPVVFVRTLAQLADHTAAEHLPRVDVPTLVIGGERDGFTPAWLSRKMAEQIPGAELVMVPGGTHTTPLEAPELVWEHVQRYLAARKPTRPAARKPREKKPSARRPRPSP